MYSFIGLGFFAIGMGFLFNGFPDINIGNKTTKNYYSNNDGDIL